MLRSFMSSKHWNISPAGRIVLVYLLLSAFWILISDLLISRIGNGGDTAMLSIIKGWLFVIISAAILYHLIRRHVIKQELAVRIILASEERLNLVLQSVNDGVWDWDLENGRAYLSPKFFEIIEFQPEKEAPDPDFFMSMIHADDRAMVLKVIDDHLGGKNMSSVFEFRTITRQGTLKWIWSRGKVVERDTSGQPLRMLGTITDISERKKIEQALQESEKRYRAVVEDQTEIICRFLPSGILTFVNDVYCRLFGKSREELLGRIWQPLAFPDDLPEIEKQLKRMTPEHPVVVVENRIITGSGEVRWMQFVNRGFYDENGALLETQVVGRDITVRRQAEEDINSFLAEVHDLYNNAPCGYHSLDENGLYVRVNDTELKWLGYERDEIVGRKTFADLIPEECRPVFWANFAGFKQRGSVEGLEYVMVRKDGSRIRVLLNATYVEDEKGRYMVSRGAILDITERKKVEESMRQYAHRLLELEEEMRKKLAEELHDEIGRDLTALGLNIALMHDGLPVELHEKLDERFEDAGVMLESISRTVRGLMSKLRPPVLDDYGLPAAMSWHCELFSKRSGLAVELSVEDGFPRLSTDRELAIFRIAQEAMTNISKHANASTVKVTLSADAAVIRLSVSDDGAGFDAANVSHDSEGSHWGLTMMRERAEAANGRFRLETSIGAGTTILAELGREA